jgi:dihydroorotate dehydrogenase electron transfer subunit
VVDSCEALGAELFLLRLILPGPDEAAAFQAGQFAQLAVPGHALPRPFSILRSRNGKLELLVKQVGSGTAWLAGRRAGDRVATLWPLGHGFRHRLAEDGRTLPWLLVGGGVGIAPLIALQEQESRRERLRLLFGYRDRAPAEASARLHPGLEVLLATEDGSLGFPGRVTELLSHVLEEGPARLFCCGPAAMMEAVAALARERDLPCLLSLETLMGCGIGICVGCAVPCPDGGYALACQAGPVFPSTELVPGGLA